MFKEQSIPCPYCNDRAVLVSGSVMYPDKKHMARKSFYRCLPCRAHVGCHPDTDEPLGTPAKHALRQLRNKVHQALDPLWKRAMKEQERKKWEARTAAYEWLAKEMGLKSAECHIGKFDERQCLQAIWILTPPYGWKEKR